MVVSVGVFLGVSCSFLYSFFLDGFLGAQRGLFPRRVIRLSDELPEETETLRKENEMLREKLRMRVSHGVRLGWS